MYDYEILKNKPETCICYQIITMMNK